MTPSARATVSDDSWKARVLAKYRQQRSNHPRGKTKFGSAHRPLQLQATIEFVQLCDKAAQKMDVNRSTFYRRAVAVVAAAILDIDPRVLLWETPAPGPYGVFRVGTNTRDLGVGIEEWCPHPGCNGEHLRPDG